MDLKVEEKKSNLQLLRELTDKLSNTEQNSPEYSDVVDEIYRVIIKEKKVIKTLKRATNKVIHYEAICSSILAIIDHAKVT